MKPFKYPYRGAEPSAPFVLLNIFNSITGAELRDRPALADTGADVTILPVKMLQTIGASRIDFLTVAGLDGVQHDYDTYRIRLQIRNLPLIDVELLGTDTYAHAIVGRDVLNRYDIHLDGPNRMMTISEPS